MAKLTDRPQPGSSQPGSSQPGSPQPGPPQPGQQPPPRSPFLLPAPRPQLPPADPKLRQRAAAALALAILSLLAMLLISNLQRAGYVAGVALAVAVIALVLGIPTLSAAKRAGARRPRGALAGVVLGVFGLLISGFALLGFLIFGAQIDQYSSCMNGAGTVAEQQACQNQLDSSITSRIDILGGK